MLTMISVYTEAVKQISEKEGLKIGYCRMIQNKIDSFRGKELTPSQERFILIQRELLDIYRKEVQDCVSKRYKIYDRLQKALQVPQNKTSAFRINVVHTFYKAGLGNGLEATQHLWRS